MNLGVTLQAPTLEAVEWVADHLREADRQELEAAHGYGLADAVVRRKLLRAAAVASLRGDCLVAMSDRTGEPVAVLGVAPTSWIDNTAAPWLLGTDEVVRCGRALVVLGREAVADWAGRWTLENWVDARNAAAVRWLQRIGFTLDEPAPRGASGVPFRRFHLRKRNAAMNSTARMPAET